MDFNLSDEEKEKLTQYAKATPYQEIQDAINKPSPFKYDLLKSALGQGTFRDTGRESEGLGESIDSLVGAPARRGIKRLQDARGLSDIGGALKDTLTSIGKDPKSAPTGFDIAENTGLENPYAKTAIATAVDLGAQLPIPARAGVAGVIKKLDGPLFHGTFKDFPANKIKPSRSGYVGPGVYMADEAKVAKGYGDTVHAYNPKKVEILDLLSNDDDAMLAAEKLGLDKDAVAKRINNKFGGPPSQTGRFYALQDEFINKVDPDGKLIGDERPEALINALKDHGFTGFKYQHNGKPAFNVWDAENLKPAHKYQIKNVDGDMKLWSEPVQSTGTFMGYDSVNEIDPEVVQYLEKNGISPEQFFRIDTLESNISGYGSKALQKMEEAAKKRGAEVAYLNASPMGILGIPLGMDQKSSAAKLKDYYTKHGYEVAKDYGTNAMMVKKLRAQSGLAGEADDISNAARAQKVLDAVKSPEQAVALKGAERESYLKALDEIYGDRAKRAKDLGFGDKVEYHGGPAGITAFRTNPRGANKFLDGVYSTPSHNEADRYAGMVKGDSSIYELRTRAKHLNLDDMTEVDNAISKMGINPDKIAFDKYKYNPEMEGLSKLRNAVRKGGVRDTDFRLKAKLENAGYGGVRTENDLVTNTFDPSALRRTDAAFDPRFKDSDLLLAGKAGVNPDGLTAAAIEKLKQYLNKKD